MKKKTTRNKILDSLMKIYEITQKYDPITNYESYQELSILWLDDMTTIDKLLIKHHAKRTLKLMKQLDKENIQ